MEAVRVNSTMGQNSFLRRTGTNSYREDITTKRKRNEVTDVEIFKRIRLDSFLKAQSEEQEMNAKGIINDWSQRHGKAIEYMLVEESGPDHKKSFTVCLLINDEVKGTGVGSRLKDAQQKAAMDAVNKLNINNNGSDILSEFQEDPKSKLNETLQERKITCQYDEVERRGPDHAPIFIVQLYLNGIPIVQGSGRTKKDAERSAARQALQKIENGDTDLSDVSDQNDDEESVGLSQQDAKCKINAWAQARRKTLEYLETGRHGADHALSFTVVLRIDGVNQTSGSGRSLQKAEQEAAEKAVKRISAENGEYFPTKNFPRFPDQNLYDELALIAHTTFEAVTHNVIVSIGKETVVAAIIMEDCQKGHMTVLSLGSGNVFIEEENLGPNGENIIDSHAEIIAKRGFQRVLYDEANKLQRNRGDRLGILGKKPNGHVTINQSIKFHLYISKSPCGDGSTFTLSQPGSKDESGTLHHPALGDKKQGRLTAKLAKGEGAIPVSNLSDHRLHKMSCSDKICKWNVLGLQGALLSKIIDTPVFLSSLIVGDVYNFGHLSRAVCCRVKRQNIVPNGSGNDLTVNHPEIGISGAYDRPELGKSKPISVNWNIVDGTAEVTNGRTGKIDSDLYLTLPVNHDGISRLCKRKLFQMFKQLQNFHYQEIYNRNGIYYERAKMEATRYQEQKAQLYDVFRQKGYGSWKERENKDNFSV